MYILAHTKGKVMKYIVIVLITLVSGCAIFDRNDEKKAGQEVDTAERAFVQYCDIPVQVRGLAPQAVYDAAEGLNRECEK
jgi:hypothetical protein